MAGEEGGRGRRSVGSQIRKPRRQERSASPDIPPVRTGVPLEDAPGFQFCPTDEDLVVFYLRRYISGQPLPKGVVVLADVYGTEPWNLVHEGKEEAFFFARRTRKSVNSRQPSRTAGGGSWKALKGEEEIKSAADGLGEATVGIKNFLSFKHGKVKYSGWVMYEYELFEPGDRRQKFQEHVLCHLKRTRVGKSREKKRELLTPTVSYAALGGNMTGSSSCCKDDPCATMMPHLKKMRGSSAGVDHAAETSWTSSYIFSRAGGIGQVDSSMLPEVAADRMPNYSTEETAATPLLLQERQVKIPASSYPVEENDVISGEETLVTSVDDIPLISTLSWSETVKFSLQKPHETAADQESVFVHEETPVAPSLSLSSMMAAGAAAEAEVESKEQDTSRTSLLQPLTEEQQQRHGGDRELLLIMDRSSITIDDLFIPDLGSEVEDGDLDLTALDDIPLWS